MKRLMMLLLVLYGVVGLPAPLPAQAQSACPGFLPSRLVVGQQGRVLPGPPNNVRDQPTLSGAKLGEIPGGASFVVLEGPVCGDSGAWWRVQTDTITGWTMEGQGQDYWLEPLAPQPTPNPQLPPTPSATPDLTCTIQPSDLQVGMTALAAAGLSGVRMRETPAGNPIGESVQAEETVLILAGPECALLDGKAATWWQVQRANGTIGWVMQQSDDLEFFIPLVRACSADPNLLLRVGELAELAPLDNQFLLTRPNLEVGTRLILLQRGEFVHLLEGPLCDVSENMWWRVTYHDQEGWVLSRFSTFFGTMREPSLPFPDEFDDAAQGPPQGQLVITTDDNTSYLVNADGSDWRTLATGVDIGWYTGWSPAAWSPDGRTLAIAREVGDLQSEIFLIDVPPPGSAAAIGDPRPITALDRASFYPAWSPDGSRIAFYVRSLENHGDGEIWVMGSDGSNPELLYNERATTPAYWSPDSAYLAFRAESPSDQNQLIVLAVDNPAEITILDKDKGINATGMFAWLPGQNHIAFWEEKLHIVSVDGTLIQAIDVPMDYTARTLMPSPDGRSLLINTYFAYYVVSLDSGERQRITFPFPGPPAQSWEFMSAGAWSPDGLWIATLQRLNPNGEPFQPSTNNDLYLMDADGSGRRPLGFYEDVGVLSLEWRPPVR